jgi:uncharacterized membrane protein
MLPYTFYKVLHIIGIVLLMSALGGVTVHVINGGTRQSNRIRGLVAGLHGLGALCILVGGFGMLARLGFKHGSMFPGWLLVKLAVWLLLAASLTIAYRRPGLARPLYVALPILGGLAAYMAIYKPF